jgi:hypothetical protein
MWEHRAFTEPAFRIAFSNDAGIDALIPEVAPRSGTVFGGG